ncbi:alpha/beta fold hydrolase [Candidatus Uhrbacteria bacterium]|nr:alpha/beta fold hydrolase [Candidatus Uhrbacteria bacterium]
MPERISFVTRDMMKIVGDWQPVPTLDGVAILVHMMSETRKSWGFLQRSLARKNIASLAIDLRGHGESIEDADGLLDYKKFTDDEHQMYSLDVQGALDWVRQKGISLDRIFLIGASIGANVSVAVLAEEPRMAGAVLFSPGKNYNGMEVLSDADNLSIDQALLIIAAEDDNQSFADTKELFDMAPVHDKIFLPYKVAGHGTAILNADSSLADKISTWMFQHLNRI